MRTARFWICRGREETPYNSFFFHESRRRDGPAKYLENFSGWVTVDAYGVNDGVYIGSGDRILASCCHAHARRKFEAAKSNDPQRASRALAIYRQLYDIEDRGRELSPEDRLKLRQQESMPLLEQFKEWLDEQKSNPRVLPKSEICVAVRYALNQWKPLLAFTRRPFFWLGISLFHAHLCTNPSIWILCLAAMHQSASLTISMLTLTLGARS